MRILLIAIFVLFTGCMHHKGQPGHDHGKCGCCAKSCCDGAHSCGAAKDGASCPHAKQDGGSCAAKKSGCGGAKGCGK